MAVCVAADPTFFAGGAQLGYDPGYYGNDPGAGSASGQSDGAAEAGMEAPPSPQSTAFSGPLLQPEALKGSWHDWSEDQSDIMTEYTGGSPGQWSLTNSDGSWPSPPSAAGDWLQTPTFGRGHCQGARAKRRFCTSYPDVGTCRRGSACTYAHSREEISANLLEPEEENQEPAAMTDDFFMYKYKTRWCPKGVQHEWHTCVYAHNYQDARRPVHIGYGARLCPYWSKKDTGFEYSQRCPLGLRCPYAHGAKEQLYHPQYFKTIICRDLRGSGGGNKACPRHTLCAFYHNRAEKRTPLADEGVDYSQPLPAEGLPADWVSEFLSPPFLPEGSRHNGLEDGSGGCGKEQMQYGNNMMQQCGMAGGMQMPYVILMPVSSMMPSANGCNSPTAMSPMGSTSPDGSVMQGMPGANWVMMPTGWSMDGSASPSCGATMN